MLAANSLCGATPYGLSIYGSEQIADGGVGDGYGDGRAASICTVDGWELQLKGSGRHHLLAEETATL